MRNRSLTYATVDPPAANWRKFSLKAVDRERLGRSRWSPLMACVKSELFRRAYVGTEYAVRVRHRVRNGLSISWYCLPYVVLRRPLRRQE